MEVSLLSSSRDESFVDEMMVGQEHVIVEGFIGRFNCKVNTTLSDQLSNRNGKSVNPFIELAM